ncbi:hypothetical protein GRF29_216g634423 [Pseudopithomyces chartarum]|uniref:Uncharacterized protein n=1 Tax=Pseudopithomyces chartarum TaxID=1892770 RepID=A0AAN6LP92_9PLEO|nr:hypothetical protein GRF29_216g634423 [Pseudopithomyces chartarum]
MPGRNRQPRQPRGGHQRPSSSSHTNTSNRSQPQGFSRPPRRQHRGPDDRPVPAHASIQEGAAVSIVLKVDQPTGSQVRGIVADLLTRGDHPRGVKVRLRDGRVGRVQCLVSEAEGLEGEALAGGPGANVGRNGENGMSGNVDGGRGGRGARGGKGGYHFERDIRENDEYFYDESKAAGRDLGLFAQLEEADRGHAVSRGPTVASSEMATCPVCGNFEGDERAVAFHVEEHFAA